MSCGSASVVPELTSENKQVGRPYRPPTAEGRRCGGNRPPRVLRRRPAKQRRFGNRTNAPFRVSRRQQRSGRTGHTYRPSVTESSSLAIPGKAAPVQCFAAGCRGEPAATLPLGTSSRPARSCELPSFALAAIVPPSSLRIRGDKARFRFARDLRRSPCRCPLRPTRFHFRSDPHSTCSRSGCGHCRPTRRRSSGRCGSFLVRSASASCGFQGRARARLT